MCACCGSERSTSCFLLGHSPPCYMRQVLSLSSESWNSSIRLDWLTREPRNATSLPFRLWDYKCLSPYTRIEPRSSCWGCSCHADRVIYLSSLPGARDQTPASFCLRHVMGSETPWPWLTQHPLKQPYSCLDGTVSSHSPEIWSLHLQKKWYLQLL